MPQHKTHKHTNIQNTNTKYKNTGSFLCCFFFKLFAQVGSRGDPSVDCLSRGSLFEVLEKKPKTLDNFVIW